MDRQKLEQIIREALVGDWDDQGQSNLLLGWTGYGLDGDVEAVADALVEAEEYV